MALRRANQINSVSGLCITKLDVLDGLDTLRLCVGYRCGNEERLTPPIGAEAFATCEPIYEDMPGWKESTVGVRNYDELPVNARAYLKRIEDDRGSARSISSRPVRTVKIRLSCDIRLINVAWD